MNQSSIRVVRSNRIERRRERTRGDLLSAAVRVLAAKGLHASKIADIAAAADVGVGTFYLHFPTKEALFGAVVEETVARLKAAVDAARAAAHDPLEKMRAANAAFCRFAHENREVFRIVFGHGAAYHDVVHRAQALFAADVEQTIRDGIASGVFVPLPPALVAQALVGMATQVLSWWTTDGSLALETLDRSMTALTLRGLYEKAKRDQWNATDHLPWATSVDPEAELLPDQQIPIFGTHIWDRLTPAEVRKLRREALAWTLSQFMHGEQGALLATAQIVDATPSFDAKLYGASQVMDEARHVEVYARYLQEKLTRQYPVNRHLKVLLDQILTDSRWDMKYLGMQILVEGLAMAAFGFIHQVCREPLLVALTHNVMRDESRHVAFGVLALQDLYADLSAAERRDREEFLYEGCRLMRDRLLMEDVWEEMGWPVDEVRQIVLSSEQMREFRKLLFSKVVPNVKRLGLLTPTVRKRFAELDILKFEHEEPSA